MNIFVIDKNVHRCAEILDDLRLNKMIIETCQLFAYALANNGCPQSELPKRKDRTTPYKTKGSHLKHPCTLWAGKTKENYKWLFQYFMALNLEREKRGFDYHACKMNAKMIRDGVKYIPNGNLTPFANCSEYKGISDVYLAYRNTMIDKWNEDVQLAKSNPYKRSPKWTNTSQPSWYK